MEPIGLQDAIEALRKELSASIVAAADEELRFEVGQITIEMQVAVERKKGCVHSESRASGNGRGRIARRRPRRRHRFLRL